MATVPLLEHLSLVFGTENDGKAMAFIADMLEARVCIPGCKRLNSLDLYRPGPFGSIGDYHWLNRGSLGTQIRILRVLLPSLGCLSHCEWNQAFEPCFRDIKAPYLESMQFYQGHDGSLIPWQVFESTPALVKIRFRSFTNLH